MILGLTNTTHAPEKGLWLCGSEAGRSRQVLELDGTNDLCQPSFFDDLEASNSFTLAFRFYLDGAQSTATKLFAHGDAVYSNPPFMLLQLVTSSGEQRPRAQWFGSTSQSLFPSSPDFALGANQSKWFNFIIRWDKDTDSGKLSYFIDGMSDFALATVVTHTSAIPALGGSDAQQKCTFGAYHVEGLFTIQHLDGKMSGIGLWDSRLSDAECDMYRAGISPTGIANANLKHYWDCSGDGEDFGTALVRDEADAAVSNGASFTGLP